MCNEAFLAFCHYDKMSEKVILKEDFFFLAYSFGGFSPCSLAQLPVELWLGRQCLMAKWLVEEGCLSYGSQEAEIVCGRDKK